MLVPHLDTIEGPFPAMTDAVNSLKSESEAGKTLCQCCMAELCALLYAIALAGSLLWSPYVIEQTIIFLPCSLWSPYVIGQTIYIFIL